MLYRWAKVVLLSGVLCGLCTSVQANTTAVPAANAGPAAWPPGTRLPVPVAQTDITLPSANPAPLASEPGHARIALLLPLRSAALGLAADAVRAGFRAAHEREPDGVTITLVETGDMPQDVLSAYAGASARHDIVVGPLTRAGVAAVAGSGVAGKPTIALAALDSNGDADARLPAHMLIMGLSIEDEARQAADWASRDDSVTTAYVLHTTAAWQRRAAKAFAAQWRRHGLVPQLIEIEVIDGFLNAALLDQLNQQIRSGKPAILFAALDAWQARQLRESAGSEVTLYGTSQMNPFALSDRAADERLAGMDDTYLLDIPWQLQADHPAVMVYPRLVVDADQKPNPDFERLYALGIDAYRVAREVAARRTDFVLDGVTGRLTVRFGDFVTRFQRTLPQAVYRDGRVISAEAR